MLLRFNYYLNFISVVLAAFSPSGLSVFCLRHLVTCTLCGACWAVMGSDKTWKNKNLYYIRLFTKMLCIIIIRSPCMLDNSIINSEHSNNSESSFFICIHNVINYWSSFNYIIIHTVCFKTCSVSSINRTVRF